MASRRSSGSGSNSGQDLPACFDLHGAVAACGSYEFLDAPTGLGLDVVADCQGGEHDGQVSVDGFPFVVVDGPGLQVVLGHPEALLDAPELVVGADDELRC